MMRLGHESFGVTIAINEVMVGLTLTMLPWPVVILMGLLTIYSSDWPDLDHPPSAINRDLSWVTRAIGYIVRKVSWKVWEVTKNKQDKIKPYGDCHRDFTHTVEGCLLFSVIVSAVSFFIPYVGQYWWCWGIAVLIGCVSHIVADWPSPAGVPWSVLYNYLKGGPVWKRHRLGKYELFRVGAEGENKVVAVLWLVSLLLLILYTGILKAVVMYFIDDGGFNIQTGLTVLVVIAVMCFSSYKLQNAYKRLRK